MWYNSHQLRVGRVGEIINILTENTRVSPPIATVYLPQGLCDNAEPNGVVTHVLPILTHLANDPDVFVQTSTVPAFAVMLQRCSGN